MKLALNVYICVCMFMKRKKKALQEYSKKLIQHLMWTWKKTGKGVKDLLWGRGELSKTKYMWKC